MKRLDAEEAEVKASADRGPTRADVAAHLADLARLYDSAKPETRPRIAQALFARVEVLGPTKVWLYPSEEAAAQGWATAMSGEFTAQIRRNGRGERDSPFVTHVPRRSPFTLVNRTRTPARPRLAVARSV